MIFVDSTVWIDYFNGKRTRQTDWLHASLDDEDIAVGDLILCEVLQGFNNPMEFAAVEAVLHKFPVFELCGHHIALHAAQNFQALRRRGITVRKVVDTILATYCLAGSHQLLHNDRDFDPFEQHLGLKVIHP